MRPDSDSPVATLPPRSIAAQPTRFGEELPIFCERCGYSFNGLPQIRCERCEVLHFSCPECGHHQPINTLRPAVQRMLGRLRALGLAVIVFLKINFFFWSLFLWGAAGGGMAYTYNYYGNSSRGYNYDYVPTPFELEGGTGIFLFGIAFAMIGRMLLLRWSRGAFVGLAIGTLVVVAMTFGAHLRQWESSRQMPSPMESGFMTYLLCAFAGAVVGGACVWGIWIALANTFLPKRIATSLIEWQRAMSVRQPDPTRVDGAMSVTV